uniref:AMP-dependent synthetase/ligase domain-containing protein n=1 Tax=Clastoptera arizonana TaxID=38151 RepID=A0A1B6EFD6_9HEMI
MVLIPNSNEEKDEIMKQLKDSGAVCVIAGAEQLETVKTAIDEMKLFSQDAIKLITLNMGKVNINSEGTVLFSDMVSDYVNSSELSVLRRKHSNPDDLAFLPYSSGTTGLPKGVMLSNKSVLRNLLQIGISEITPFTETAGQHQEVLPAIIPFYHIYGLTLLMTQSLIFGSKIVTLPKFEPKLLLDTLKFQQCSILYFVPPLLLFLGSNEKVTSDYFKHVHTIVSGAAPMGESDIQRLFDKIPVHNRISYVQGYGLTEASPVVTYPHKGNNNYSTVGSPLPNTMLKVIDVENGKSLGPNQGGEICLKGPQVMLGYLNNITATASVIDKNGWLQTGDLGHYDEKGLFYITERIKELIKVKGFQVPPAELEEVLRSMPGIKDAGVFGMPDKKSGEVPIAFIVKSTKALSASDVKEFMFKKVAPFKQLSDVVFVETIPKSGSGKILRREMLKIYKDSKRN